MLSGAVVACQGEPYPQLVVAINKGNVEKAARLFLADANLIIGREARGTTPEARRAWLESLVAEHADIRLTSRLFVDGAARHVTQTVTSDAVTEVGGVAYDVEMFVDEDRIGWLRWHLKPGAALDGRDLKDKRTDGLEQRFRDLIAAVAAGGELPESLPADATLVIVASGTRHEQPLQELPAFLERFQATLEFASLEWTEVGSLRATGVMNTPLGQRDVSAIVRTQSDSIVRIELRVYLPTQAGGGVAKSPSSFDPLLKATCRNYEYIESTGSMTETCALPSKLRLRVSQSRIAHARVTEFRFIVAPGRGKPGLQWALNRFAALSRRLPMAQASDKKRLNAWSRQWRQRSKLLSKRHPDGFVMRLNRKDKPRYTAASEATGTDFVTFTRSTDTEGTHLVVRLVIAP